MKEKRKRIFEVIQIGNRGDAISRGFDYFIVAVIIINVAVLFMETFQVFAPYYDILRIIEGVTIAIFIVEYILRLWTADLLYPKYSRGKAILRFIFSFDGIVDLLTILPFFFLSGFVALRILPVVRIFRMFKINSTYDSFSVISTVFRKKKKQIASSVFIIFLLIVRHRPAPARLHPLPPRAGRDLELSPRLQGERRHLLPQQSLDRLRRGGAGPRQPRL